MIKPGEKVFDSLFSETVVQGRRKVQQYQCSTENTKTYNVPGISPSYNFV